MMSENQKGVEIRVLDRRASDTHYTADKMSERAKKRREKYGEWYVEQMERLPVRNFSRIPITFHGKGGAGYWLYDIVEHKGESAPKFNRKASDLIRYYGTEH